MKMEIDVRGWGRGGDSGGVNLKLTSKEGLQAKKIHCLKWGVG